MKDYEVSNFHGYNYCPNSKATSEGKIVANKIEDAIAAVNRFYASTYTKNQEVIYYVYPDGSKRRLHKRFIDEKEVTTDHFRSVIIKECEDRGLPVDHVLKIGGWIC